MHSRVRSFPNCNSVHHLFNSFSPCVSVTFLVAVAICKSNLREKGFIWLLVGGYSLSQRGVQISDRSSSPEGRSVRQLDVFAYKQEKREVHTYDSIASSLYSVRGPRPKNSALPNMPRVGLPLLS